jgi:Ca2+-transporting ATPase
LSAFQQPLANRWLNLAVVWEWLLLMVIVYLPFLHEPLGTFALAAADWALVFALALTVIPVLEIAKWMQRRGWLGQSASVRRPGIASGAV